MCSWRHQVAKITDEAVINNNLECLAQEGSFFPFNIRNMSEKQFVFFRTTAAKCEFGFFAMTLNAHCCFSPFDFYFSPLLINKIMRVIRHFVGYFSYFHYSFQFIILVSFRTFLHAFVVLVDIERGLNSKQLLKWWPKSKLWLGIYLCQRSVSF